MSAARGQPIRLPGVLQKHRPSADALSMPIRARGRGQAVVEFALVLMLFVTLLFGIFDFGMVMSDWVSATTAASVGARQASVGSCFLGTGPNLATCANQNATSVIGAVLQSAPLLAADGNCQNPAQPAANFQCLSRVDVALVDVSQQRAQCESVEMWYSRQTARSSSTSTVISTVTQSPQVVWPTNSTVGMLLTFTSGANEGLSRAIATNSATSITVASAFPFVPALNDAFQVSEQTFQPITAGWLTTCSGSAPSPQINDTLSVFVHTQVELPAPLPALPAAMQVESSSTVRFEGVFIP
jgi:TadE-like protein